MYIFVAYVCALLFAVYVYTVGFFIVREQLPDLSQDAPFKGQPLVERAVLLIIDALRYDFVACDSAQRKHTQYLPILCETLQYQAHQTVLLQSYSDPPTVTLQRIKALVTGNLPSFIDMKNNFQASELTEDNLVRQLKLSGRKVHFMGDDTWLGLFPQSFDTAHAFDSFNVGDLHSVDQGVDKHLFPLLKSRDYDLIIAHFLGVDHVGHTYDFDNTHMTGKLKQLDEILRRVINHLDEKTLLIVMSDHGMTSDGNHGGASAEETNTVLFAHLKSGFQNNLAYGTQVEQIDLVPTLSMLLGVPIPYSNLGEIIAQLLPAKISSQKLVNDQLFTVKQTLSYLQAMQIKQNNFDQLKLEFWEREIRNISYSLLQSNMQDEKQIESILAALHTLSGQIKQSCREVWNQFDQVLMFLGMTAMLLLATHTFVQVKELEERDQKVQSYSAQDYKLNLFLNERMFYRYKSLGAIILLCFLAGKMADARLLTITTCIFIALLLAVMGLGQKQFKQQQIGSTDYSTLLVIVQLIWFRAHTQLSVNSLRTEDYATLATLLISLPLQIFCIKKNGQCVKGFKIYKDLFMVAITLFIASYFDQTDLRKYLINVPKWQEAKQLLQSSDLLKLYLPLLYLAYLTHNKIKFCYSQAITALAKLGCITFYANFIFSCVYLLILPQKSQQQKEEWLIIYLPRLVFALGLGQVLLLFTEHTSLQTKRVWSFLSLFPAILMLVSSKYTVCIALLLFCTNRYLDFVLETAINKTIAYIFLGYTAQYFWFVMGHRAQLATLDYQSAYTGLETFNLYAGGTLLAINTYASQVILGLWLFSDQRLQNSSLKVASVCLLHTNLVTLLATSLNCTVQQRALLLIEDFAPKYLFEVVAFVVECILMLYCRTILCLEKNLLTDSVKHK